MRAKWRASHRKLTPRRSPSHIPENARDVTPVSFHRAVEEMPPVPGGGEIKSLAEYERVLAAHRAKYDADYREWTHGPARMHVPEDRHGMRPAAPVPKNLEEDPLMIGDVEVTCEPEYERALAALRARFEADYGRPAEIDDSTFVPEDVHYSTPEPFPEAEDGEPPFDYFAPNRIIERNSQAEESPRGGVGFDVHSQSPRLSSFEPNSNTTPERLPGPTLPVEGYHHPSDPLPAHMRERMDRNSAASAKRLGVVGTDIPRPAPSYVPQYSRPPVLEAGPSRNSETSSEYDEVAAIRRSIQRHRPYRRQSDTFLLPKGGVFPANPRSPSLSVAAEPIPEELPSATPPVEPVPVGDHNPLADLPAHVRMRLFDEASAVITEDLRKLREEIPRLPSPYMPQNPPPPVLRHMEAAPSENNATSSGDAEIPAIRKRLRKILEKTPRLSSTSMSRRAEPPGMSSKGIRHIYGDYNSSEYDEVAADRRRGRLLRRRRNHHHLRPFSVKQGGSFNGAEDSDMERRPRSLKQGESLEGPRDNNRKLRRRPFKQARNIDNNREDHPFSLKQGRYFDRDAEVVSDRESSGSGNRQWDHMKGYNAGYEEGMQAGLEYAGVIFLMEKFVGYHGLRQILMACACFIYAFLNDSWMDAGLFVATGCAQLMR